MLCSESIADWVKHCFITKFNSIEATAYNDYLKILRNDILTCHKHYGMQIYIFYIFIYISVNKNIYLILGRNLDPTYTVTRRVGLAQVSK